MILLYPNFRKLQKLDFPDSLWDYPRISKISYMLLSSQIFGNVNIVDSLERSKIQNSNKSPEQSWLRRHESAPYSYIDAMFWGLRI